MPERQCPADLILYHAAYDLVDRELRCVLNTGHEGMHMEGDVGWTTSE